ncbi:hypothetical protein RUM44_013187 [Polyplax serrata]|uniref:DUF4729 domain-containing protein n=1 Tax=Polyplax serrata TaxID=468196 RepID=A0ABR1BDF8_POLSC
MDVIFPKIVCKSKHLCAICKGEMTKTRNLFAECLLAQLDTTRNDNKTNDYLSSMKISVPEPKVQTNYLECCYNIYGSPCTRFDGQSLHMPTFEPPQPYSRYPVTCTVPQYNFQMEPYVVPVTQPQLECPDQTVYYPEYDNMAYYNCINRRDMNERRSKFNFNTQGSVSSLCGESSKRPIRCPTHLCGRNIAVAALSSHFCFDHPEVPPLNLDFDVTCHLFIDPEMIPFNYGRCVAILLIPNKCEAINSVSHPRIISASKIKNSLPLVVMASKLDCSTPDLANMSGIHEEISPEVLNHGDFQAKEDNKSRLFVIWLAGVDFTSSICTTIQVTEKQTNLRSVIYTGPIMNLRACQSPSKVFEQGDCLVIHSGILESIVGNKGGFDLHVVVH